MSKFTDKVLQNIELKEQQVLLEEMFYEFPDIFPEFLNEIEGGLNFDPNDREKSAEIYRRMKNKIKEISKHKTYIKDRMSAMKQRGTPPSDAEQKQIKVWNTDLKQMKRKEEQYNSTIKAYISPSAKATHYAGKVSSHLGTHWKKYAGGAAVAAGLLAAYKLYKHWKAKKAEANTDSQKTIAQKKMDQAKEKIKVEKAKSKK